MYLTRTISKVISTYCRWLKGCCFHI